ncbi:glycosyltransferase family 39 protein [Lysobacter sp. K5869]|uniref:glycosyltransferase family 39 protein n=1 Tax=Lysobacter sp. K5869 TaxID=2820808 RepID=UPI001C0610CB|nr:glycosyltransferase family 39 protein [Lysobacter sp. K5869]QWP77061.1 glycosyltransferase family 39 protein [Lysobacter sp. K5869]
MDYLKALAALGLWPAIYPVGAAALAFAGESAHRLRFHPLLALGVGSALATLLLMLLARIGAFVPTVIGACGWVVLALWCWRERVWTRLADAFARARDDFFRHAGAALAVTAIVATAGYFYAMYPKESLLGERDEGIYAQHALHLLRTGGSVVDLSALGIAAEPAVQAVGRGQAPELPGIYPTGQRWTYQFSAATPAWMAMLAAPLGPQGIFRFNALLGALNCIAFYCLLRRLLPARARAWAVPALAVFAFQPAQVWVSRNTLSEPLCAWFLAVGLFAASVAVGRRSRRLGLVAGALIGMGCFVRIDAIVFALAAAAAGLATVALDRAARQPRAAAVLGEAAFGCYLATALAMGYFLACVQPYLLGLADLVVAATVATVACAFLAHAAANAPALRLRGATAARLAWPAAAAMAALFVYALWIRPHVQPYAVIESKLVPQLNGNRDYRETSLLSVAAYLSWPTVLAAGLGAALAARALFAGRLSPARAWILVFLLVPTVVYLWRPMVSPDHIWASRRWLPAVFPACIALAAFGAARLSRWAAPERLPAQTALFALALAASLLWQQRDTLRLREDAGLVAQIGAIAERLPRDRPTYVIGSPQLASALLSGFGVPAVQPPPATWGDAGRYCPAQGDCWMVVPKADPVAGAAFDQTLPLRRLRRVTSLEPLAHGTYEEAGEWRVVRLAR